MRFLGKRRRNPVCTSATRLFPTLGSTRWKDLCELFYRLDLSKSSIEFSFSLYPIAAGIAFEIVERQSILIQQEVLTMEMMNRRHVKIVGALSLFGCVLFCNLQLEKIRFLESEGSFDRGNNKRNEFLS